MGQGPFAARKSDAQSAANRRRSTRLDYETAVVLSGRDAMGETYRHETITEIVNIHGARIRTDRKVLVGMLVTVECVKTGRGSKGVCVNTYEPSPAEPHAAIAMQLLQPGNIWGVENPPDDWAVVAASLGGGKAPADSSWSGVASSSSSAPRVAKPSISHRTQAAETAAPADVAQGVVEESVAKLRAEADAVTQSALAGYEPQLAGKVSEAEARLSQRVEQAAAELAAAVQTLREKVTSDLVQSSMEELRGRFEELSRENDARWSQKISELVAGAGKQIAAQSAQDANARATALEQRLEGIARQAEIDLATRVSEAFQGFEAVFSNFRSSFTDELAGQHERAIHEFEQAVRARLAALVSTIMLPPQAVPAPADAVLKK